MLKEVAVSDPKLFAMFVLWLELHTVLSCAILLLSLVSPLLFSCGFWLILVFALQVFVVHCRQDGGLCGHDPGRSKCPNCSG